MKKKSFFITFKELSFKQIKQNFLEGQSLTLINTGKAIMSIIQSQLHQHLKTARGPHLP